MSRAHDATETEAIRKVRDEVRDHAVPVISGVVTASVPVSRDTLRGWLAALDAILKERE